MRLENEKLDLRFNDGSLNIVCDLHRAEQPMISKVDIDNFTKLASKNFDCDFDGQNKFYPFEFNDKIKDLDFQILVITGASGSGKSTFSKYFGKEENIVWNNDKAIISNFDNEDDAVEKLCAVGLNSIPTWLKPRYVLSVGEGFRADLARKLKSNCVIDEFTSTVDRNVAMSCSKSISKYIRKKGLQRCVFVSCHKDFIDCLKPDYIIDLDDECVYDAKELPTRRFELSIYEKTNKNEIWQLFRKHHYLSADLNIASRVFIAYLDNQEVGFCAVLPQPGVADGDAWRIHRLVILPDYQGLGIGIKFLEFVSDLFAHSGKIVYIRTSHIKLINALKKNNNWKGDGKLKHSVPEAGALKHRKINEERLSASFKYIAKCKNDDKNYEYVSFLPKQEKQGEQLSLFDLL